MGGWWWLCNYSYKLKVQVSWRFEIDIKIEPGDYLNLNLTTNLKVYVTTAEEMKNNIDIKEEKDFWFYTPLLKSI